MENTPINSEVQPDFISDYNFAVEKQTTAPIFKEIRGKNYIPYTTNDKKEQYPDMLIRLYTNSSLHGAICRSIIDQVTGNGFVWDYEDASKNGQNEKMSAFLGNINKYGEDANEVLRKVVTDFEIIGSFALLVKWSADWKLIETVEHIDISKIRAGKIEIINDIAKVPGYFYSWDWVKQRTPNMFIPMFNEADAVTNKKAFNDAIERGNSEELQKIFMTPTTQIIYYNKYTPSNYYYSLPSYVGAINSIETDIQSDQYGVNSLINGLTAKFNITFFGINTPEERREAGGKFLKQFTGVNGTKNNAIISFAKSKEDMMQIDTLANSKEDKIYNSINENVFQKILSAHRITDPLLVGIKTSGQLGAGEELKNSIDFWNKTVITPLQMEITKVFNKIMKINGLPVVSIEKLSLYNEVTDKEKTGQEAGNNNEII